MIPRPWAVAILVAAALLCSAWTPIESEPTASPDEVSAAMGRWITAAKTAQRCAAFLPLVNRWLPDFPDLDPALVLAVAAAESSCLTDPDPNAAGAIGLMQVIPRPWLFPAERLTDPALNLYAGMFILDAAIRGAGGDLRLALARYNCGEVSVAAGRCRPGGGFEYADRVIGSWLPVIRAYLPG